MAKSINRIHPADVANSFVRNLLCDISDYFGGFSLNDEKKTLKYFEGLCPYTGKSLFETNVKIAYDHLVPHNRQYCGLNIFGNVILTIDKVNSKKHSKDYKTFLLNDNSVIEGTIFERKKRIEKIEKFIEISGYNDKIINIENLKRICEEKYQTILEMCKRNNETIISIFEKQGHGI